MHHDSADAAASIVIENMKLRARVEELESKLLEHSGSEEHTERMQTDMKFLSESALKFLTFSSDDDIFIFIGKNLSKVIPKSVVVVFSYDQDSNVSVVRYISGMHPYADALIEILGKSPEDMEVQLPEGLKSMYLANRQLEQLGDGDGRLLDTGFDTEKVERIQNLLDTDFYYSMGMVRSDRLYGGLLIAADKSVDPYTAQTVTAFIYQAGIALHRKQMDNELVKAKLNAEESDRLKSAFLANMSHEVRTPLNGILGMAQVLLKVDIMDAGTRERIKMIEESSSMLLALIGDIMDVSKIETGQLKIKYRPVHLNSLIDRLYTMFLTHPLYAKRDAAQGTVELLYDHPEQGIAVMSDPDRLQQIFVNLIGNALKFTQQGFVRFGYEVRQSDVVFYVKDSGIGIPADRTEKIFERFIQVDNTLARRYGGSGLGLAISRGLVVLLEGRIWCESVLGTGSSFYFSVPCRPVTVAVEGDLQRKKRSAVHDWSNCTVLVVEDDVISRKVIEAMLRGTGVHLICADNGMKAIDAVRSNPQIDLVLMDMHLPEMNGIEVTARVLEMNPSLPVIAQTANAMADDRDECIKAGCVDYISKPIDMDELLHKMSRYLAEPVSVE